MYNTRFSPTNYGPTAEGIALYNYVLNLFKVNCSINRLPVNSLHRQNRV